MSNVVRTKEHKNTGYKISKSHLSNTESDIVTKQLKHKVDNTLDEFKEYDRDKDVPDSLIVRRYKNEDDTNEDHDSDGFEIKLPQTTDNVPMISRGKEANKTDKFDSEEDLSAEGPEGRWSPNDIAQALMNRYDFVVYCDQLYYYVKNLGYWHLIRDVDDYPILMKIVPYVLRDYINRNSTTQIYRWIKVDAKKISKKDLIKRKDYINFQNCALCLNNNQIINDRKDLYFMNYIPYKYQHKMINSEGSLYDRIMQSTFPIEDIREKFEEMLGLLISQQRDKKLTFFFYGPPNSGKSVFMNVCKGLIGHEFTTSLSFSQLNKEFAVANLQGKWLNVSGEISDLNKQKVDVFKSLTGNDMILTNHKFRSFFDMDNTALLLFSCNNSCPLDNGEMDAIASRMIVFPFLNEVQREDWIEDLSEKLLSEKDIIIQRAIRGLLRLKERNYKFEETPEMLECKQKFLGDSNNFLLFANKYIVQDPTYEVSSGIIRKYYSAYCTKNELDMQASNTVSKILKNKYKAKDIHITNSGFLEESDSYNCRGYRGIRLKNTEELEEFVTD